MISSNLCLNIFLGRIAVALKTSSGPTITEQQVASCITVKPPTSFILLKSVELEGKPTSVCHYKEYTYTSLGSLSKSVPRIHLNGHVDNEFIKLEGNCRGLVVGNDLLHVLTRSPTAKVLTYNFDGRLIMGRATETHEYTATKFVITVDNKIVIVNQRDKQFVIFGSAMELERQVPCTTIPCENSAMSIAVIDYESVVISDFSSSKVSKVSLIDGHVIWTSDRVPYPQGVVCYKGHYVLVTNCEPDCKIWILDAKSGSETVFITQKVVCDLHNSKYCDFFHHCSLVKVIAIRLKGHSVFYKGWYFDKTVPHLVQ